MGRSSAHSFIAETIAVGSELLLGGRMDSNSQFITDELSQLGIEVRFKSVVGDDRTDIVNVLKTAVGRAKVIVMTGGLGPTVDDCTREAIAQAARRKLARRKDAFEGLQVRLAQWGRTPNKGQLRQALIPSGAIVLTNPVGSAPGFWLSWKGATLISLPGVPGEMKAMMRESVIPLLTSQLQRHDDGFERQPITRLLFHTWGLPEADVDAQLKGLISKRVPVDLGLLASPMGVLVSLTTNSRAHVKEDTMVSLAQAIRTRLREWLFAEGQDSMEEVVGR
jgi:nicotinamide-nucleotide amidase